MIVQHNGFPVDHAVEHVDIVRLRLAADPRETRLVADHCERTADVGIAVFVAQQLNDFRFDRVAARYPDTVTVGVELFVAIVESYWRAGHYVFSEVDYA